MNSQTSGDESIARALRDEHERTQADHDRLAAEYAALLADNDVIQEDRDAAGELEMQARHALSRVEAAVARVQAGDYGHCARCGNEIPAERLAALPDAECCVACS
jgi:DnaK suppressor protein